MRRKMILMALLLVFFQAADLFAQERLVTGTVTAAEDGMSLPGVNVIIKGTNTGTITDMDGNYSIEVPDNATLVFSSVGFRTKEVAVGNQDVVNVSMETDLQSLDEVVVTSFGIEQEKKALGYAVQEINAEDITKTNQANIVSALQGQAAGVQITNSGGCPRAECQDHH